MFPWGVPTLSVSQIEDLRLAAAQMTVLALVVGGLYRRSMVDKVLEWAAAGTFGICLVSALALGLAGK